MLDVYEEINFHIVIKRPKKVRAILMYSRRKEKNEYYFKTMPKGKKISLLINTQKEVCSKTIPRPNIKLLYW
jgi:hypothetical protein